MAGEVNDMPEKPPEPFEKLEEFPKVTKIPGGVILQGAKHPDDWDKYRPGDSFGAHDGVYLGGSGVRADVLSVKTLQECARKLNAHRETETDAEFTKRLREGPWPLDVDAAVANGDSK